MKNTTTVLTVIMLLAAMAGGIFMYQHSSQPEVQSQVIVTSPSPELTDRATASVPIDSSVSVSEMEVPLYMDEKSQINQSGKALLTEENGRVIVKIEVDHPDEVVDPQPAHIHKGKCPAVGAIVYPLTSLEHGTSETVIHTTLSELKKQFPLAINIHKSQQEPTVYAACGQIE